MAAVVADQRVVDAEVRGDAGEEGRPAVGAVHREPAGAVVLLLCREQAHLEVDDRVALRRRQRRRSLRVPQGGGVRLVGEVEVQGREARRRSEQAVGRRRIAEGLAAVPHHRAEEAQVGRRQRAPEQRQLGRAREPVRVVDLDELELRRRRNADADADQALLEQHAVRLLALVPGRDVGQRRVRAVDEAKHRIHPLRLLEALAQALGRDRPAFLRLMAGHATAPVAAELAEERIAAIDEAVGADRHQHAAGVAAGLQLRPVRAAPVVVVGAGQAGQVARQHQPGDGDHPKVFDPQGVLQRRRRCGPSSG